MAKDRWQDLCKLVESDDGLVARDAGKWTEDKLWFWHRYIEITTDSMAHHKSWNGVAYIDMFAGPGVCAIRGTERRIPGSTVIAANSVKPCAKVIAVELNQECAAALEERLAKTAPGVDYSVIRGDCNKIVDKVVSLIPERSLALAFFDAEGLDFHFETVRQLTNGRAVDLLVLFADAYDIVRNVDFYESQESSRLDQLLGTTAWRDRWREYNSRTSVSICDFFASEFEKQLSAQLNYTAFRRKRINGPRGALYTLIFASKHELGGKFWDNVTKKDVQGQMEMF